MKKILIALFVTSIVSVSHAQIASDVGSNYEGLGEPLWTNGSNAGFGFGAWVFSLNQGTGGAGAFIGDPSFAGISGMNTESFGLFANPAGSGASVNVGRSLNTALQVGQTFSFDWGINWDGDNGINGNKGFNLFVGTNQVVNVNNGGNSDIQFNTVSNGFGFGTAVMTWSFTMQDATTLAVSANDRDGTGTFTTNVTVSGGISSFELYASNMGAGDQRQPYYNNFQVVPEPSTIGLAIAGLAGLMMARRRKV